MKKVTSVLFVLLLLLPNSFAGLRGPGRYYGVVIFDRWDACYIYSGVYLMYVSERTKDRLRKYQGRSMRINALEVFQPINPGDGLIGNYRILGSAKTRRAYIQLEGLKLTVAPNFMNDGSAEFDLEIFNVSEKTIEIKSNELALTLLRKKPAEEVPFQISSWHFGPSDGPSYAIITRYSFRDSRWEGTSNNLGEGTVWTIGEENALPGQFELQPGRSRVIPVSFQLPAGEYDFLCGYGGGVHEDKSIASNLVAFNVNEEREAMLVSIAGR